MAYLDENGLEHFWGKIKDHVDSAVAPKANDADVVHKTGDEIVQGEKVFKNEKIYSGSGNSVSNISIRNPAVERGTATSLGGNKRAYSTLYFLDNEGSDEHPYNGRLAVMEYVAPSTNDLQESISFSCYDYFSENGATNVKLSLGYDLDRIPYATAPETSDDRTNSTDIVTRGYMEASEWNWQKSKKNALVQFKPAPESDLEPVVDFMFTEIPPVSGYKGPENPSTITGVSQTKVTRCGKNLCPINKFSIGSSTGLTVSANTTDGYLSISGTAATTEAMVVSIYLRYVSENNSILTSNVILRGETYTFSLSGNAPSSVALKLFVKATATAPWINRVNVTSGHSQTYTIPETAYDAVLRLDVTSGSTVDCNCYVQVEKGSISTSFEPYSGNDYTILFGDTYYGGSLDVAAGVMTVTYKRIEFSGNEGISTSSDGSYYIQTYYDPMDYSIYESVSTHFPLTGTRTNPGLYPYLSDSSVRFGFGIPTSAMWADTTAVKNYLQTQYSNGTPVSVCYKLYTPFTVQLTPTQIRSLPALDKYEPRINTVYTDQEAVRVGYQRYAGNTFNDTVYVFKNTESIDGTVGDCIRGRMGYDDVWRIGAGATAQDSGFLEIATGDNGTEPIYVSQYHGGNVDFTALKRRVTLLDSAGNSVFPGHITSEVGYRAVNKDNVVISANDLYTDIAGVVSTYYTSSNSNTKITDVPTNVSLMLESKTVRRPTAYDYHIKQFCYAANSDISYRYCTNGNWSAWKQFAFVQDVVTLVTNQEITGAKYFTYGPVSKSLTIDVTDSSSTQDRWHGGHSFCDKNNNATALYSLHYGGIERVFSLRLYDKDSTQYWVMFWSINHDGTSPYIACGGSIYPTSSGNHYCGTSNRKWAAVYAVNGTIQTSDERVKEDIASLPDSVLDAWDSVEWQQFRMKDSVEKKGSSARLHSGIIAQRARDAFASAGLDASDYGFFCFDRWDEVPAQLDEQGNVAVQAIPAGEQYSIRYDEALALEAAYMRRENARLKKRVADLEERLAALELKIS